MAKIIEENWVWVIWLLDIGIFLGFGDWDLIDRSMNAER
jgi:hypothetical protein